MTLKSSSNSPEDAIKTYMSIVEGVTTVKMMSVKEFADLCGCPISSHSDLVKFGQAMAAVGGFPTKMINGGKKYRIPFIH